MPATCHAPPSTGVLCATPGQPPRFMTAERDKGDEAPRRAAGQPREA